MNTVDGPHRAGSGQAGIFMHFNGLGRAEVFQAVARAEHK